jgi:hypothetical protein
MASDESSDAGGLPTEPRSKCSKKELMAFAGVWTDIDADSLIEYIYRARHEAPPSPPVDWPDPEEP